MSPCRTVAFLRMGELLNTKWEVQTSTLCDGWINVWTWEEGDDGPKRQLFDSEVEAKAAIYDFLIDVAEAPDILPYNVEDYRVVEVEA